MTTREALDHGSAPAAPSTTSATPAASSTTSAAFDHGAAHYDLMVGLNPGYHAELRRAARDLVERILEGFGPTTGHNPPVSVRPPRSLSLLDLACGSGASTRALLSAAPAGSEVLGLDASDGMLAQARRKRWPDGVRFDRAVAGDLDLAALGPASFDGVLTAYLFRNLPEDRRDRAASEIFELLRPGGWVTVQEYSVADDRRARAVWDAVCGAVIVPLGGLVGSGRDLYRYLWRSVVDFESFGRLADRFAAAGFDRLATRTATGWQRGILHTLIAHKPEVPR